MKRFLSLSFVLVLAGFGCVAAAPVPTPTNTNTAPVVVDKSDLIRVTSPDAHAVVQSPLHVTGDARGTWYFEAVFPVRVLDANGQELGVIAVHSVGDWMTEDFVPFAGDVTFRTPTTATGTVVFEQDNPSGLPENADELRIPVRFAP